MPALCRRFSPGSGQCGEATREGVHGVSPIGGVVLSGVIVSCFRVLRLRVWKAPDQLRFWPGALRCSCWGLEL